MKYKPQLIIGLLGLSASSVIYAETEVKPSYSFGLETSYRPTNIQNHHGVGARLGASIPIRGNQKHRVNLGISANYNHSEPVNNEIDIPKHSGYEQTKVNIGLSHQLSDSFNVSYQIGKPVHYNDKKFNNEEKVAYGASLQWVDTQNFAIATFLGYRENKANRNDGIKLGNSSYAGVSFKYGFSPRAEFSLGAIYKQQKPTTQSLNGKKVVLSPKERGVGAMFGVNYAFDRKKQHQVSFDMETGIGEIGGSLSMEYRYAF